MHRKPSDLLISRASTIKDALALLNESASGVLLMSSASGTLERTITDGDIRRLLLNGCSVDSTLDALPAQKPVVITEPFTRRQALELMKARSVNYLPVIGNAGQVLSLVSRADLDDEILLSSPHLGDAEREFVNEAFRTNWIAPLGPNVDKFEHEFTQIVGVGHAAALSSGTAALHVALRLLGVERSDCVFCSALTFAASVNPIVYQGAEPVLIDSEPESWNMSPVALRRALEAHAKANRLPKAVIVVNLYGQSADMDRILPLCAEFGVPVIEDAAESLGALYKGRPSGSFGLLAVFSFNGTKIITTSGGGMLVSNDAEFIRRARFLSTQARDPAPHYQHSEIGYNYRMSNLLAGVGRGQLKVLHERVETRRAVFSRYASALADIPGFHWMPEPEWSRSTRWLTTCTLSAESPVSPMQLIQFLASELIEARPVWKPMQMQPVFAGCRFFAHDESSPAVSEQLFLRGLCLPSGSNMQPEQIDRIIVTLRRAMGRT
jgi:dTDP-4-amino-4,6-dideoxygalactose transaminase